MKVLKCQTQLLLVKCLECGVKFCKLYCFVTFHECSMKLAFSFNRRGFISFRRFLISETKDVEHNMNISLSTETVLIKYACVVVTAICINIYNI